MKDNIVLFPHIRKDIEKIVERADNVFGFEENIAEIIRKKLASRNWKAYRGEAVSPVGFGGGGWNMSPSPCCVCLRTMGTERTTENGFFFWTETNGDLRCICPADYHRWWTDNNGVPA